MSQNYTSSDKGSTDTRMPMTISQGLREAKRLKNVMHDAAERMKKSATYNEKEKPAFSFKAQHEIYIEAAGALVTLETQIARANASARIEYKKHMVPLAWGVRLLAELKAEIALIKSIPTGRAAVIESTDTDRVWDDTLDKAVTKVTVTRTVYELPEAEQAKKVEELMQQFYEMNTLVENENHKTFLPAP